MVSVCLAGVKSSCLKLELIFLMTVVIALSESLHIRAYTSKNMYFSLIVEHMADLYPNKQFCECLMSAEMESLSNSIANFASVQSTTRLTFAFWLIYREMVQILLPFLHATRENNWELHLSAVRSMLPWFFVADRVNYARYGTIYWLEIHVWKTLIQVKCYISAHANDKTATDFPRQPVTK